MDPVTATVRIDPDLRFFLPVRHRHGVVTVDVDSTATIGHVVESLGVPRTEFGDLSVGGNPARPCDPLRDGDVVDVPARPRPQPLAQERFLLDVHLGTLARRMRLLGLDVAYDNDADDDELVELAVRELRVLLTKDRGILCRRALVSEDGTSQLGAYVRGDRPDQELADVLSRFAPSLRPWTRCPACNGMLAPVAKADIEHQLKAGTRRSYAEFSRCDACGRVYWRGAHSRRLQEVIASARRD